MLYCAYGSNLHPGRLSARIDAAKLLGTAQLSDWALRFHKRSNVDNSGKCNIVPARARAGVYAAIFALDESGLARLDEIEGRGVGYEHTMIRLPEYGSVLAYVAQPSHIDEHLLPFGWYKEFVLAGCRYHGFDRSYVDSIHGLAHREDPDRHRHQREMKRIATMRFGVSGDE